MEQTIDTNRREPAFSWKRMAELNHYFGPSFGKLLLYYLIASAVFGIILLLPVNEVLQMANFTLISSMLPYMFSFAPLVMGKRGDSRIIERLLPATPVEKYVYLLLYFLVAVPAVVYAIPQLAEWLYTKMPSVQTDGLMELLALRDCQTWGTVAMNVLGGVATTLLCLYVVEHTKTSRVIKGIVSVFVSQFAIGVLGAFYGMATAFHMGYVDGQAGVDAEKYGPDKVETMIHDMMSSPYMVVVIIILAVYMLTMFYLNFRQLKKSNL